MISIVVPNYNGFESISKNLPKLASLLAKTRLDFELIVVDDASTDPKVREFLENFSGARVIFRTENGGFPISADLGIREAKGEVVFMIKNDSIPENVDYFKLILGHFKDPKVFAVSSALRTNENGKEEIRGQGRIVFFRGLFFHFRRRDEYLKWLETSKIGRKQLEKEDKESSGEMRGISAWPDGASSAYKRELYLKIGGFDKVYRPGYWEDTDLGYRAWKAGYRVEFEPKAMLLHDFESGAYRKKYGEKQIRLINLRNQFIFTLKNSDKEHLWEFFKWEIYNHGAALKSGNHDFIKAYWMAFGRLPEIIGSRIYQKKVNKLSDNEVLPVFQ